MIFYTDSNRRVLSKLAKFVLSKIFIKVILRPIFYEVLFMSISVIALATLSQAFFERFFIFLWSESKPNITTIIAFSFLLCLVAYHVSCYVLKPILSKNFPRHMDYVYLTSAAIGLLGASEVAKFQLSHHYLNQIENRKQELKSANEYIKIAYKNSGCYRIGTETEPEYVSPASDCKAIVAITRFFETSIKADTSFESLSNNFNSQVTIIKNNPVLSKTDLKYVDELSYNLIKDADMVASPDQYWLPGLDKFIGYLLVATALSLRITKVTVEIYKWHRQ